MTAENRGTTAEVDHALKNYLALIMSHCDLLLLDLSPNHSLREDILNIRKAAETAHSLIPRHLF